MRWAQGFGYGGVGSPLYGASTPPGFWALLILEECSPPGGVLDKDTTMNKVVNFKSVRKLFKKDHPPFVILHQQKLVFITKEAGKVLDVSNPAWPLRQSTRSGIKHNPLPVISSTSTKENLDFIRNTPSFSYPSWLIRHFLQLNQPEAGSFNRWALRELIPFAVKQRQAQPFTRSRAQLLGLENEEKKLQIRQVLVVPGGIEAKVESRISGLDEEQHTNKGAEPCPKP